MLPARYDDDDDLLYMNTNLAGIGWSSLSELLTELVPFAYPKHITVVHSPLRRN